MVPLGPRLKESGRKRVGDEGNDASKPPTAALKVKFFARCHIFIEK